MIYSIVHALSRNLSIIKLNKFPYILFLNTSIDTNRSKNYLYCKIYKWKFINENYIQFPLQYIVVIHLELNLSNKCCLPLFLSLSFCSSARFAQKIISYSKIYKGRDKKWNVYTIYRHVCFKTTSSPPLRDD